MLPVTVHAHISAPREEIFDYVGDLGARVAWCDHFMRDYRLATPSRRGRGTAARYRLEAPLARQYVETQIVEYDPPRRIVEATHGGRAGRTKGEMTWELERAGHGLTRVQLTIVSEPGTPREAVKERLGMHRWTRRQSKVALERLRVIFEEEPEGRLARTTVAGWEPSKGPRFGTGVRG
jgi:uncharacterized protein YndB with AHSA1/START domain